MLLGIDNVDGSVYFVSIFVSLCMYVCVCVGNFSNEY